MTKKLNLGMTFKISMVAHEKIIL